MQRLGPFRFLSLFVVIGAGVLLWGVYVLIRSVESNSWPSVDGVVKTSELGSEDGYAAEVTYDYKVNERLFTGNKIRMMKLYGPCDDAQEDLLRYPVGAHIKVFYSPADCSDAVLEPGVHPSSWFLPLLGGLFIVGPLLMMFAVARVNKVAASRRETLGESATRA